MTTNGQRGAKFEHETRDVLTDNGYVVIRSAASKSPVDLVALTSKGWLYDNETLIPVPGHVLLIQCKTNGKCDPAEWNHLYELAGAAGAVPVLAVRERDGRKVRVALYRMTGPKDGSGRRSPKEPLSLPEVRDGE